MSESGMSISEYAEWAEQERCRETWMPNRSAHIAFALKRVLSLLTASCAAFMGSNDELSERLEVDALALANEFGFHQDTWDEAKGKAREDAMGHES